MLITQTDVFPTYLAETTILEIREINTYSRVLGFKNLTSDSTMSFKIEESTDGGATWTTVVPSFTVAAGEIGVKVLGSLGILRIKSEAVSSDAGVMISYARSFVIVAPQIWLEPVI